MWVKQNLKTVFLDPSEYFLNLGNIEENQLKKIVIDTKFTEVIKLQLTKKMISGIQEAFSILDCKSEGTVTARDVKVTLRSLGIEPTSKKVKKLIDKISLKRSGKNFPLDELSREEYEKMMSHVIEDIDSEEQMIKSFKIFDINETGTLSTEDLKTIAHQLELNLTDEEIQEMINIADNDKDGKVTIEEFKEAARKIY